MERLEGHLGTGLTNRLGADSTDGRSGLDHGAKVLFLDNVEKLLELVACQPEEIVHHGHLRCIVVVL